MKPVFGSYLTASMISFTKSGPGYQVVPNATRTDPSYLNLSRNSEYSLGRSNELFV